MTSGEALLEAIAANKVWAISALEAPVAAKASCCHFYKTFFSLTVSFWEMALPDKCGW